MSVHSKKEEEEEEGTAQLSENDQLYNSDEEEYDEDEEYETEEEDDDDEDEPKLRYRRVGASVKELLDKDTASTLRVCDRFVVIVQSRKHETCYSISRKNKIKIGFRYSLGCSPYSRL